MQIHLRIRPQPKHLFDSANISVIRLFLDFFISLAVYTVDTELQSIIDISAPDKLQTLVSVVLNILLDIFVTAIYIT